MTTIELRAVRPGDDAFLEAVYAGTREEEMALVPWTEEEKSEFLAFQYRAQAESYTTRFPNSEHSIILVDGEPAGRVWVDEWDDEIRLLDIAILPEFRSRGAGGILLERLQQRARDSRKALRHSVHISNEAAIRFYRRAGFTIVADYDFETHYLMEWTNR